MNILIKTSIFFMLSIGIWTSVDSQAPTLDPNQTVNNATGDMAFALPLGTIKGIGGVDFPLTLNYQAGIKSLQEASPAGLGFSYGAGGISRKVVGAADDNVGGPGNFNMNDNEVCSTPRWLVVVQVVALFASMIIGALTGGVGEGLVAVVIGLMGSLISMGVGAIPLVASQIFYGSLDFNAGGPHTPSYDFAAGQGKGMFQGGERTDLPDVYFVSTPFFNGQFTWIGDPENGRFVLLTNEGGGNTVDNQAVKIEKRFIEIGGLGQKMVFTVTLKDGTRLVFNDVDASPSQVHTQFKPIWDGTCVGFGECDRICHCEFNSFMYFYESTTNQWHLTAVLPPNYVDGSVTPDLDPLNSTTSNKGPWIAFEYAHKLLYEYFREREAQSTNQTISTTKQLGGVASNPVRLNFLSAIRTPNEYAIFIYPETDGHYDRTDVYWKKGDNIPLEPEPRLERISLYEKNGAVKRNAIFNHSYTQRYSWSWDERGPSLTLESITIKDGLDDKGLPPIIFEYDQFNNPSVPNSGHGESAIMPDMWDGMWSSEPAFSCRAATQLDYKDLWGYYFSIFHSPVNVWNENGALASSRDGNAAAWSVVGIILPNGLKINWDYEPDRYDRANGQVVRQNSDNPPVPISKFGGGIRVKKMTVKSENSKTFSRSYIYTNQVGVFKETESNSSGYASVEPFGYALANEYRPERCRGGLYTPAVVAYEMVQVVDNLKEPDQNAYPNGYAPNGFDVMRYTHCGDQTDVDNYFPNDGRYGQIDRQWKRGFLVSKRIYNNAARLQTRDTIEYNFVEDEACPMEKRQSFLTSPVNEMEKFKYGWVRMKNKHTITGKLGGVVQPQKMCYASDITPDEPDNPMLKLKKKDVFEPWAQTPRQTRVYSWDRTNLGGFTRTKLLGNQDIADYVAVVPNGTPPSIGANTAYVFIGVDVPSMYSPPSTPREQWAEPDNALSDYNVNQVDLDPAYPNIIGVGVAHLVGNNPDTRDLLIFTALQPYWGQPWGNMVCKCIVLPNITFFELNNQKLFRWDNTQEKFIYFKVPTGYAPGWSDQRLVSCAMGDFNNNGTPDVVFLEGTTSYPGLPIDSRHLLGFPDITASMLNNNTGYELCVSDLFAGLQGDHISFIDWENNGIQNDIEISGQSYMDGNSRTAFEYGYPIRRNIFPDISMDMNSKHLGTPVSNAWQEDHYLYLGKNSASYTFNYLGMSEFLNCSDYRERKVFAVFQAAAYGEYPKLTLIHRYDEPVQGDYDGVPNRTYTKNTDGSYLVSTSTPAYWKYPAMGHFGTANNKHLLSQECGSTTFHIPNYMPEAAIMGNLTINFPERVVASTATTWAPWPQHENAWLPLANYVWRVPMNASGLPTINFASFNYSSPQSSSPYWKLTDSISQYASNYLPKETAKPTTSGGRYFSSTIFGRDEILPAGSVTNARWKECGVFTCDYQTGGNAAYFDYANGWDIGAGVVNSLPDPSSTIVSPGHFGVSCVRVNNTYGPSRNFQLQQGRDYIMSAWVKVISGKAWMHGDFHKIDISADINWPITSGFESVTPTFEHAEQGPTSGSWVLLKMRIPARTLLASEEWNTHNLYARVFVGSATGGEVYIDDIRFAPTDAFTASTYFDPTMKQAIISIDANNCPGKRMTFDSFGRPTKWEKIDPSKVTGDVGYAKLLQERNYHFRNDLPAGKHIQVLYPDGGENSTGITNINIYWVNDGTRDVVLSYKLKNVNSWPDDWTTITTKTGQSGWCSHNWVIPNPIANQCKIKAEIVGVDLDSSDLPFFLSR